MDHPELGDLVMEYDPKDDPMGGYVLCVSIIFILVGIATFPVGFLFLIAGLIALIVWMCRSLPESKSYRIYEKGIVRRRGQKEYVHLFSEIADVHIYIRGRGKHQMKTLCYRKDEEETWHFIHEGYYIQCFRDAHKLLRGEYLLDEIRAGRKVKFNYVKPLGLLYSSSFEEESNIKALYMTEDGIQCEEESDFAPPRFESGDYIKEPWTNEYTARSFLPVRWSNQVMLYAANGRKKWESPPDMISSDAFKYVIKELIALKTGQ